MTELERAVRQQRRIHMFWIAVTFADLLFCLWAANASRPGLYLTWRGVALLALSGVYVFWMCGGLRESHWVTIPGSFMARCLYVWGVTLVLTVALFLVDPMMGWLGYPLLGMSFMFELPWALLAALLSFGFIPATLLANGFENWRDLLDPTQLVTWGFSFAASAGMIYLMFKLMRDRMRREVDMAELEQVHRELEQAHERLAASAEQERELAVLRERGRLARDMHDTLGHALVLVAVKLEAVRRLREVDAGRAERELEATQQIVRDAMAELRASLAALRSPTLERESLARMLAAHAREAGQRAGWHVIYDMEADLDAVDPATREALLRVGTEALTNAERHAHARTVTLTLRRDRDDHLLLRVADNGAGINLSASAPSTEAHDGSARAAALGQHYGITGMRERVAALGGRFSIGPGASGGTVVEACAPIAVSAAAPLTPSLASGGQEPSLAIAAATVTARATQHVGS